MATSSAQIKELIDTSLGKTKADLAIVGADLVNVYTGELLENQSVAIKRNRIAFVGDNAEHAIGPDTNVVNATGKILIPGLIDAHTHLLNFYSVEEFLKYIMRGGTTTVITEIVEPSYEFGVQGVKFFLDSFRDQPIKIFATIPSMVTLSPSIQEKAFQSNDIRKLFQHEHVVGLGETFWFPVLYGDKRIIELFAETIASGKIIDGHGSKK
jgi:adenine deaminase